MGVRETLNENPRITTGVTVAIIVVVLAWILWPQGGGGGGGGAMGSQVFYTTDDGKTWFADDADKIPPFEKDGKQAVRAVVYKCGGKTFVNHLERYTPDAQKKLAAAQAKAAGGADAMMLEPIAETGLEVKSPGDKTWARITDPRGQAAMKPKCEGDGSDLEVVMP